MAKFIIPGKMVKQGHLLLDSREDGSLHVKVDPGPGSEQARLDLTEEQALLLHTLLEDMIDYSSDDAAPVSP